MNDDKEIFLAMQDCIEYLNNRFSPFLKKEGYTLKHQKTISYGEIIKIIRASGDRKEFDCFFDTRTIIPDGGFIMLQKNDSPDDVKVLLVSEIKRQGTNDARLKAGKPKQSQGNAIERLGKNLTGIKAMFMHQKITPFVCFGAGCDFVENYGNDFVMSKLSMLNEFYPLNTIQVNKKDGDSNRNYFSPVSMFFREQDWTRKEMFEKLKEVGECSMRHYIF